ncbi:MAG: hypothetical protein MUD04_07825 [Cyanobium sp. Prado107]|jgi:hypothetical protein|nr:hypothetical protein [Cyanobium sp. Prado107]
MLFSGIQLVDLRTLSLIGEALLGVFLLTLIDQGRMICLGQRGYVRSPHRRNVDRMRERLQDLLELS